MELRADQTELGWLYSWLQSAQVAEESFCCLDLGPTRAGPLEFKEVRSCRDRVQAVPDLQAAFWIGHACDHGAEVADSFAALCFEHDQRNTNVVASYRDRVVEMLLELDVAVGVIQFGEIGTGQAHSLQDRCGEVLVVELRVDEVRLSELGEGG